MNQVDSNQISGCNIKIMTANSSSSSACLKDGNNVEKNASNDVVGTFSEQKHIGKYLRSCAVKVLKAEIGKDSEKYSRPYVCKYYNSERYVRCGYRCHLAGKVHFDNILRQRKWFHCTFCQKLMRPDGKNCK